MPWLPLAIGAAIGLAKTQFIDKPKYEAQRKLASDTQRFSPYTGMKAETPSPYNYLEGAMTGGLGGMAMAGNLKQNQLQNENQELQNKWLAGGHSPYSLGGTGTDPALFGQFQNSDFTGPVDPNNYSYRKNLTNW